MLLELGFCHPQGKSGLNSLLLTSALASSWEVNQEMAFLLKKYIYKVNKRTNRCPRKPKSASNCHGTYATHALYPDTWENLAQKLIWPGIGNQKIQ